MSAGCRRTAVRVEAAGSRVADWLESRPGCRRGYSSLRSPVCTVPAVESLFWRVRHLAVLSPGIQAVVNDEPRQMGERRIGGGDRGTVGGGPRQQHAGGL